MSSKNPIAKQRAYLRTLQLDQSVTDAKLVRKQFRKLAARYHPDHVAPEQRDIATEKMKVFEEAKSWLVEHISALHSAADQQAFAEMKEEERRKKEKLRRKKARQRREEKRRREELERRKAKKLRKQSKVFTTSVEKRKLTALHFKWSCKEKKVRFVVQLYVGGTWTEVYSGKKKSCSIEGLSPGTKHEFRLGYVKGQSTVFEGRFSGTTLGV